MNGRHLTPTAWKTMLVRRGARRPVLPGREHTAAASEPLAPILFSAWGRLERAGVLQTLAAKWLGAGKPSDGKRSTLRKNRTTRRNDRLPRQTEGLEILSS